MYIVINEDTCEHETCITREDVSCAVNAYLQDGVSLEDVQIYTAELARVDISVGEAILTWKD